MEDCDVCGSLIEIGWVACPFCGNYLSGLMNPNISILEYVENSDCNTCQTKCNTKEKKPYKSKCCKKYEKKKKHCKRCPELAPNNVNKTQTSVITF